MTYSLLLMHVVAYRWRPTIWRCAAWFRPVWYRSTGSPYWANGSVIGRARNLLLVSPALFLSMAVPALPPSRGKFNFSRATLNRLSDMPAASAPIRIGYCLSLTGPVADNSRSAQLAHEIWRDDINRRGGLRGRSVEFVRYDDHADASQVPGIYKRLMDEDKVDLVIGGYGTQTVFSAVPLFIVGAALFVLFFGPGGEKRA